MPCPEGFTRDDLAALASGELDETRIDLVADHIEHCTECAASARELEREASPLEQALREAGGMPRRIGPYVILEEAGRGGMGVVYKARHETLGRVVALKLMAGPAGDLTARARFQAEARAVATLEHPNIVRLLEAGEQPGAGPFLALEYVAGGSLARRIAGQPQAPLQAAAWAEALARAAHHAHEAGIVHRDVKPSNVLLDADGTPRLCDFGIARLAGACRQTRTGHAAGTAEYMAPEQADTSVEPGPAADVYSLGAVLYACLTGRPPFQGSTPAETLALVLGQEPVPPSRLSPSVPRDLETVCLKCLEKRPEKRYASAAALADDLRRFLDGRPITARPAGWAERVWKAARRHPLAAALLIVVACVAGLAVAGVAYHNSRLREEVEATRRQRERADDNARSAAAQRDRALGAFRRVAEEVDLLMRHNPQLVFVGGGGFLDGTLRELEALATEGGDADPGRAQAHLRLGELHAALRRPKEAERHYRAARALAERRLEDAAARAVWLTAAAGLAATDGVGFDPDAVERAVRPWIAEGARTVEAYRLLMACHNARLRRAGPKGTPAPAKAMEAYLADALAWAEAVPSPEAEHAVVTAHIGLATARRADRQASDRHLQEAVRRQERVFEAHKANHDAWRKLAAAHDAAARIWCERGEYGPARRSAQRSLGLLRAVASTPGVPQWRRDLVSALILLGQVEAGEKRYAQGLAAMREAVRLLEQLDGLGLLMDREEDRKLLALCRRAITQMTAREKGG